MHQDVEEEIFFPWLAEKATVPTKKYSKYHEDLIEMLKNIGIVCLTIIYKKGENWESDVQDLATQIDKLFHELRGK